MQSLSCCTGQRNHPVFPHFAVPARPRVEPWGSTFLTTSSLCLDFLGLRQHCRGRDQRSSIIRVSDCVALGWAYHLQVIQSLQPLNKGVPGIILVPSSSDAVPRVRTVSLALPVWAGAILATPAAAACLGPSSVLSLPNRGLLEQERLLQLLGTVRSLESEDNNVS